MSPIQVISDIITPDGQNPNQVKKIKNKNFCDLEKIKQEHEKYALYLFVYPEDHMLMRLQGSFKLIHANTSEKIYPVCLLSLFI